MKDLEHSYSNGALVNREENESESTYSIADPIIPHWVTSEGSAWYICGECDKELPSKDWCAHWKTASHAGKEKYGTVPCIDVLTKKLCKRSIDDFKETNKNPKLAKWRSRLIKGDSIL